MKANLLLPHPELPLLCLPDEMLTLQPTSGYQQIDLERQIYRLFAEFSPFIFLPIVRTRGAAELSLKRQPTKHPTLFPLMQAGWGSLQCHSGTKRKEGSSRLGCTQQSHSLVLLLC